MNWEYWISYWFNEFVDVAGTIIAGLILAYLVDYKDARTKAKAMRQSARMQVNYIAEMVARIT